MQRSSIIGFGAIVAAGVLIAAGVNAAPFPTPGTPITIIVPYAPGGTTDTAARLMAAGLEQELKTPVQVVNKAGAASQVGMTQLIGSAPNGYTLALAVLPTVITHYLDPERKAPYTRQNFQPVGLQFVTPAMLAVQTESRYRTLKDLVEAARANPDKITISDSGLKAVPHLTVLVLQHVAGVRFASVHFDGGAPSVTALLGGHVEVLAGGVSDAVPNVKAGKFRVLGVSADEPDEFLPGIPTMRSQGYDVITASSTGILAPAGTPKDVVDILTAAMKKIVGAEDHKKKLTVLGVSPRYLNPDDYAALWTSIETRVGPVLQAIKTN